MPIKLPKGFPRRKSAGNALEEVPNPPEPSFRVFERPRSGGKSFDGGHAFKRLSEGRPLSQGRFVKDQSLEDDRPTLVPNFGNRASGGTQHSASSGGPYDTSSSSARFSSSSTLPSTSSVENFTDDSSHAHPKSSKPLPRLPRPIAQPGYSPSTVGSAFPLSRTAPQAATQKSTDTVTTPQPSTLYADIPDISRTMRPRAMTETSGSTATPPKLLDTEFGFGHSDELDDFANMFEGMKSEKEQVSRSSETLDATESDPPGRSSSFLAAKPHLDTRAPYTPPPPLILDRNRQLVASPYSNNSRTSLDGLMASSPQEERGTCGYNEDYPPASLRRLSMIRDTPSPGAASPTSQSREQLLGPTLRRESAYDFYRRSTPIEDADSILAMDSVSANHRSFIDSTARNNYSSKELGHIHLTARSVSPSKVSEVYQENPQRLLHKPLGSKTPHQQISQSRDTNVGSSYQLEHTTSQLRTLDSLENEDALLHDLSFREMAKSAERFQTGTSSPLKNATASKVMTPAQFERYRKENELSRSKSKASESDESEGSDNYEDDEDERNKQSAKQRRKQDAHFSVYRQQMMKVTGEQPSGKLAVPGYQKTGLDRLSMSSPNLAALKSTVNLTVDKSVISGRNSGDEDEDEDVPLGILAAHGFPSKDKPRTQFGQPFSSIRYTSETYPLPPPAIAPGSATGGGPRGTLPPFARNLPKDPYYGASIVNPSNRESLAFGTSRTGSVYGGSQAPSMHPGGLVGVIASEERSRAMRRGSPNTVGGYGLPGSGLPLPPSLLSPSIPTLPPGDPVQLQLSHQMTQMMQMQMQWMQQMMAMQSLPPGQPAPQMPLPPIMQPGFSSVQSSQLQIPQIIMQRPHSVGGPLTPVGPSAIPHQQRAMSMLSTEVADAWPQRNGNRASLAPTLMMSGGLGPALDYSPSITPSERSNVGMPSRYRPVSIAPTDETSKKGSRASTMSSATALRELVKGPIQALTVKAVKAPSDDDDEEEGWQEMHRKRERNRQMLRGKKDGRGGALGDIFYPGT